MDPLDCNRFLASSDSKVATAALAQPKPIDAELSGGPSIGVVKVMGFTDALDDTPSFK
jgi:hypothetical protein